MFSSVACQQVSVILLVLLAHSVESHQNARKLAALPIIKKGQMRTSPMEILAMRQLTWLSLKV